MTPLVSILIPLYNEEKNIEYTLKTVIEQPYENIEIIVVDDHSTDNSVEIVKNFNNDKIKLFTNPKKGGQSSRNYAFAQSKGKYVKFLDADDWCTKGMIKKQVTLLENFEGGGYNVCVSPVEVHRPDGTNEYPSKHLCHGYKPGAELLIDYLRYGGHFNPHSVLIPREIVEKAGPWDEKVIRNQDSEFLSRVFCASDRILNVSDEYAIWNVSGSGVSSKKGLKVEQSYFYTHTIMSKLAINYKNTPQVREYIGAYLVVSAFCCYPSCVDEVDAFMRENNIPPIVKTSSKKITLLSKVFGWKLAVKIFNKIS